MIAVDTIAITVKNKGDKGGFCSFLVDPILRRDVI